MMKRRRFLSIAAAAVATPAVASAPRRWYGHALGADVSMKLHGAPDITARALEGALTAMRRVEQLFSLYDPSSALVKLNAQDVIIAPPSDFLALFRCAADLHRATGGAFDPTIQALWQAHVQGADVDAARAYVGWERVRFDAAEVRIAPGQSLTFNGIAQGYATDLVIAALKQAGLRDVHVNIGEQAAMGAARQLGIKDPTQGMLGNITLRDAAIATSSPAATLVGTHGHILSPKGTAPRWSTVSVLAASATMADGLSTALCLMTRGQALKIRALPGVQRIVLADTNGDVISL